MLLILTRLYFDEHRARDHSLGRKRAPTHQKWHCCQQEHYHFNVNEAKAAILLKTEPNVPAFTPKERIGYYGSLYLTSHSYPLRPFRVLLSDRSMSKGLLGSKDNIAYYNLGVVGRRNPAPSFEGRQSPNRPRTCPRLAISAYQKIV